MPDNLLTLTPTSRPQVLLNNRLLADGDDRQRKVKVLIQNFSKDIHQRPPLIEKAKSLRSWRERLTEGTTPEDLDVFYIFLTEDGICFSEDRERLVTKSGSSLASKETKKWEIDGIKDKFNRCRQYESTVCKCCPNVSDSNVKKELSYVVLYWKDRMYCTIYSSEVLECGLRLIGLLADVCAEDYTSISESFQSQMREDGRSDYFLFCRPARVVLDELLGRALSGLEYEAVIEVFLPSFCKAEGLLARILSRPAPFVPVLNEAIWERYQSMRQKQDNLASRTADMKQLIQYRQRVIKLLGNQFKLNIRDDVPECLPDVVHKQLSKLFSGEDLINAKHVSTLLYREFTKVDPNHEVTALLWFFYLTKNAGLLHRTNGGDHVGPLQPTSFRCSIMNYSTYSSLFLALLKEFSCASPYAQLQQEVFLIMTGFVERAQIDSQFNTCPLLSLHTKVYEYANDQCRVDPAVLGTFPWEAAQREEYHKTRDVKVYATIRQWLQTHPDVIEKEKRHLRLGLQRQLKVSLKSDRVKYMEVLHDMFTPPSGGVLDENHLMQREDPTKIVLRYQDPAELPDSLSPEVHRMIARCLKEYTAMLLWREALAEELKDTWLELIYKMQ